MRATTVDVLAAMPAAVWRTCRTAEEVKATMRRRIPFLPSLLPLSSHVPCDAGQVPSSVIVFLVAVGSTTTTGGAITLGLNSNVQNLASLKYSGCSPQMVKLGVQGAAQSGHHGCHCSTFSTHAAWNTCPQGSWTPAKTPREVLRHRRQCNVERHDRGRRSTRGDGRCGGVLT